MTTATSSSIKLENIKVTYDNDNNDDLEDELSNITTSISNKSSVKRQSTFILPAFNDEVFGTLRIGIILFVIMIGGCLVIAVTLNVELAKHLGNLRSAAFNFTTGFALLSILTISEYIINGHSNINEIIILIKENDETRWWMWCGGVFGGIYVSSTILLSPLIGLTLFFVSAVAGQLISSLILDTFGFFSVRKRKLTFTRIIGTIIVLLASIIIQDLSDIDTKSLFYSIAAIGGGACLPLQAAINNYLSRYVQASHRSANVSFLLSLLLLWSLSLIQMTFDNDAFEPSNTKWYHWFGGTIGAIFVTSMVYIPRYIGVAVTFVTLITGQISFSFIFDSFGLMGFDKKGVELNRLIGVCIAGLGVIICQYKSKARQPDIS